MSQFVDWACFVQVLYLAFQIILPKEVFLWALQVEAYSDIRHIALMKRQSCDSDLLDVFGLQKVKELVLIVSVVFAGLRLITH